MKVTRYLLCNFPIMLLTVFWLSQYEAATLQHHHQRRSLAFLHRTRTMWPADGYANLPVAQPWRLDSDDVIKVLAVAAHQPDEVAEKAGTDM